MLACSSLIRSLFSAPLFILGYFLDVQAPSYCSIPSWPECSCVGLKHHLSWDSLVADVQGVQVLHGAFKLWLACAQPPCSHNPVTPHDQFLDNTQRPLSTVSLLWSYNHHISDGWCGSVSPGLSMVSHRDCANTLGSNDPTWLLYSSASALRFLHRSALSIWCRCNFGSRLVFRNSMEFGFSTGNCKSSSM